MNKYQQQCAKLAALYKEASEEGRPLQHLIQGKWLDDEEPLFMHINMKEVRVKPEEKWRSKLFKDAPVMAIHENRYIELGYWDSNIDTSSGLDIRLPTLIESPRNVWLVPSDEMPDFGDLHVMLRNKLNNPWDYEIGDDDWPKVTAFMILDDL